MALPEGLTLVEDNRVKKGAVPEGLTLVDDSPSGISIEEEERLVSDETFAPMPEGFNKGEYSSNPSLDRKLAERDWRRKQITESHIKGEVSAPVGGFQRGGQTLGKVVDIAGEELKDATLGIAGLTAAAYDATVPEAAKEYITKEGEAIGAGIFQMQHKLGIDEAVAKGGEKLVKWWDSLDKQTRRTLHATGLISSVVPTRQVAKSIGKTISKVSTPIKSKLVSNLAKEKLDDAIEFIRPHLSGRYEREALKRTRKGIYTPTKQEAAMGETLSNLKGFKVRGDALKNKDVILDGIATKSTKLNADIAKYGSEVSAKKLDDIGDAVIKLTKDEAADFTNVSEKIPMIRLVKVRELLKAKAAENGGKLTSKGVHEVRQQWDKIIKERAKKAFSPDGKQFDPILNTDKVIRNKLNDIVDETTSVNVKGTRTEVSHLMTASDNVVGRLQKTHDDFLKDVLNTIGGTARGFWATKTLAKFAGAGAAATGAAISPVAAGSVIGILGAGYLGKKMVMSRPARHILVGMMEGLNQAGKATKSAAELVKIKQHKTALAKLIANITIQENKEEK